MTELNKMLQGELYHPGDAVLSDMRQKARDLCARYNQTSRSQKPQRQQILAELLQGDASSMSIEPPVHFDYGCNIDVGENFYMNFSCVILDAAKVTFGDNCLIGPQVGIYTACHPLDATERNTGIEFAKPITIGDSCWIGGNATINPGVTLGNNVVVASGAVVTKSFGDNVVIGGNPAKVLKTLEA